MKQAGPGGIALRFSGPGFLRGFLGERHRRLCAAPGETALVSPRPSSRFLSSSRSPAARQGTYESYGRTWLIVTNTLEVPTNECDAGRLFEPKSMRRTGRLSATVCLRAIDKRIGHSRTNLHQCGLQNFVGRAQAIICGKHERRAGGDSRGRCHERQGHGICLGFDLLVVPPSRF
jgi:hypothetical protein